MLSKNDGPVQLRAVGLNAVDQRGTANEQTVLRWCQQLCGLDTESQLEALQNICSHSPVIGIAEQVIRLAGSRDDAVRVWAAQALGYAIHASPDEVPGLMSCLQDGTDGEFSYWAATLLGRLESHAAAATQALCDCLQHSLSLPARERAAWALMKIGPDAASAIPVLREVSKTAPARLKHLVEAALEMVEGSERMPAKFAA
ncbi:MAG: HEAT repeat domain-containing protein [Rubripirellula sp.]|nr:HEAT repeat domain-containing protein [Rubripirellula sp.]